MGQSFLLWDLSKRVTLFNSAAILDKLYCHITDFYHPGDEGGIAWNDPEIGIEWPRLEGEYKGLASAEGYRVDGAPLNLSDRDQKWRGLKDLPSHFM